MPRKPFRFLGRFNRRAVLRHFQMIRETESVSKKSRTLRTTDYVYDVKDLMKVISVVPYSRKLIRTPTYMKRLRPESITKTESKIMRK